MDHAMNAAQALAYLKEAEDAWDRARESSGYALASAWAMEHGRRLIAMHRALVIDHLNEVE